jgi:hypothetical protein
VPLSRSPSSLRSDEQVVGKVRLVGFVLPTPSGGQVTRRGSCRVWRRTRYLASLAPSMMLGGDERLRLRRWGQWLIPCRPRRVGSS